jgi:hypothetical protein
MENTMTREYLIQGTSCRTAADNVIGCLVDNLPDDCRKFVGSGCFSETCFFCLSFQG